MSWDIIIQDVPRDANSVEDIPDDYEPSPLGPREQLIARIQEVLPRVDFAEPKWGMLECPDYSIEFNMGVEEICAPISLHVRGSGGASFAIARLLEHLQCRAIDCQAGEFFSIDEAHESFGQLQAFRDRAIGNTDEGLAS